MSKVTTLELDDGSTVDVEVVDFTDVIKARGPVEHPFSDAELALGKVKQNKLWRKTVGRNEPHPDSARWNEDAYGGFSHGELSMAFDLVKDEEHWKNPIDAHIDPKYVDACCAAIEYFTSTTADFVETETGKVHIVAGGYWSVPELG